MTVTFGKVFYVPHRMICNTSGVIRSKIIGFAETVNTAYVQTASKSDLFLKLDLKDRLHFYLQVI